jgi:hypothetical protein
MTFLQKWLGVVLVLFTISSPAFANINATASVSTNKVLLGDVFILMVEVDDAGSEYQLDTNVLKDNFTVFIPTKNQQKSYINGEFKSKTTWQVRLQANKIGTFTIPPLKIGDIFTKAIQIEVSQSSQQQSTTGDAIFIENTVNESKIYLGQQVVLESKIYVSENITNADVQQPKLKDAQIEKIDSQSQTQIIRNGIRYQVFSYRYKITPSVAGESIINSPLLIGDVNKQFNQWGNSFNIQPVSIRGNNVKLIVKAIPAEFKGDWLVSSNVRLIENNDLHSKTYSVGDPITRSISLQVASLPIEKMPEIKLNYDSSLRYYPDQDDLKQGEINGVNYTQRTVTHAIIATKSGKIVLPEITIPWWNSKTERQEFATLPAQTLTIKPAVTPINNSQQQAGDLTQPNPSELNTPINSVEVSDTHPAQLLAWKISTFILLCLLIAMIIYHLKHSQTKTVIDQQPTSNTVNSSPYKQLLNALQQAKPNLVYATLLRYFQSQHLSITQLSQIEAFTGLDEKEKTTLLGNLQQLELACAGQTHHWDAKQLLKLIKVHHQVSKSTSINQISNLNP